MSSLKGRVAFVTGASRGIGAAAARALAEAGAAVFLSARSQTELVSLAADINATGGKAAWACCDVSRHENVADAIATCVSEFGGLDILINNAGLIDPIARLEDSEPEGWSKVIDVNVKGVYYALRAAIDPMKKQGAGTIINISSGAATSALEGWSHYCASKAAVLSLTRTAHKELAESGIHVVGLSPGTVATEMQVSIKASGINPVSQLDPDVHIPPEWVAKAIVWLANEGAALHAGTDFSLKTEEGRRAVGLPTV